MSDDWTIAELAAELDRRVDAMVADLRGGATVSDLVTRFGTSRRRIDGLLRQRLGEQERRRLVDRNRRAASARNSLKRTDVHHWTAAEDAELARDYRNVPAGELARRFGVGVSAVRNRACVVGAVVPQGVRRAGFEDYLRRRNAEGWSDSEIAASWGRTCRHAVTAARRRLGLPSNHKSPRVIAKIREAARRQCQREGVPNLGALRAKIYADRSRAMGWPADLPWRAGQILTLLWENGPMTRRQIVLALRPDLGPDPTCVQMNKALGDNDVVNGRRRPNSYLATLARRGLIIRLPRTIQRTDLPAGQRQGRNVDLYTLPLTIERRTPDAG